jgi:hypothetical protein
LEANAPEVEVALRPTRHGHCVLVVDVCPFCGGRHVHGAGNPGGPVDAGRVIAHCEDNLSPIREYVLVWRGRIAG